MEKKGFVFTFISILFVSVILIAFLIQATNTTRVKTEESRVKVETVNTFLKSIKNTHINSAIKASSARAFEAMLNCVKEQSGQGQNKLYMNPEEVFYSIVKNANLDGPDVPQEDKDKKDDCEDVIKNTMSDDGDYDPGTTQEEKDEEDRKLLTLSNTFEELITAADNIGLDLSFDQAPTSIQIDIDQTDPWNIDVDIDQTDPWNIDVDMDLDITLKTEDSKIKWETPFSVSAKVSIINLNDPIYAAFDEINIPITKWNGPESIPSEYLKTMVEGFKFFHTNLASGNQPPSYIQRFNKNEFNGISNNPYNLNCCGIETLKDPGNSAETWVDYLQEESPPISGTSCQNTYFSVRLDAPHIDEMPNPNPEVINYECLI